MVGPKVGDALGVSDGATINVGIEDGITGVGSFVSLAGPIPSKMVGIEDGIAGVGSFVSLAGPIPPKVVGIEDGIAGVGS